jgi:hypothetical protein
MEGVEEIREDPEDWAEGEEAEEDAEAAKKTARHRTASGQQTLIERVAARYLGEDKVT